MTPPDFHPDPTSAPLGVSTALSMKRSAELELLAAIADWQTAHGAARASARRIARYCAAAYRKRRDAYHATWMGFCASRRTSANAT